MNILLWVVQSLLAVAFLASGFAKLLVPRAQLAKQMGFVEATPHPLVQLIGLLEVLGGIGLILPGVTHIQTWLVIAAAAGLAVTMIGAVVVHVARKEVARMAPSVVLLVLALLVFVGRLSVKI